MSDNNRGALWPNDRKTTDSHPDFRGNMNVNGREFWVSCWLNIDAAENPRQPALKLAFSPKDNEVTAEGTVNTAAALDTLKQLARGPDSFKTLPPGPEDSDDIPF